MSTGELNGVDRGSMANRRKQPVAIELDPVAIGRRIRTLRCKRGWRQLDLANASGVHPGVIGAIEVGLRVPSRDAAIGLAVALRRSIEWILFGMATRGRLWKLANGSAGRVAQTNLRPGPQPPVRPVSVLRRYFGLQAGGGITAPAAGTAARGRVDGSNEHD